MTHTEKLTRLQSLKKEKNAVILAHYYQNADIQDCADFLGDSYDLAQKAKQTDADVILFCGVHFMAETAKILNPDKTVLVPDMEAGCSLADSAHADDFKSWIDAHPGHTVISYINSSAEVKAMSDIICTSSNAIQIVNSIPENQPILFAPDKYLGTFVKRETGRKLKLWDGACQVHELFSEDAVIKLKSENPEAEVLAHPECPENILQHADWIGSTKGIINEAKNRKAKTFIIITESGILHTLKKQIPEKTFIEVPNLEGCACNECPHMKLNTLDKMISALENIEPQIQVKENLIENAKKALDKMLETGK